jgi:hypothetical protein
MRKFPVFPAVSTLPRGWTRFKLEGHCPSVPFRPSTLQTQAAPDQDLLRFPRGDMPLQVMLSNFTQPLSKIAGIWSSGSISAAIRRLTGMRCIRRYLNRQRISRSIVIESRWAAIEHNYHVAGFTMEVPGITAGNCAAFR